MTSTEVMSMLLTQEPLMADLIPLYLLHYKMQFLIPHILCIKVQPAVQKHVLLISLFHKRRKENGNISHQRVNVLPLISFGTECDPCSFGLSLLLMRNEASRKQTNKQKSPGWSGSVD